MYGGGAVEVDVRVEDISKFVTVVKRSVDVSIGIAAALDVTYGI